DWRGKCTYLQIAPRSRMDIPDYAEIGRRVGEAAGEINGAYGEAAWTPIRYGMNLVAKEFIAAQDPEDPGVLILSRFAGAARECKEALIVNPYDTESVGGAIVRAFTMSLRERQRRHEELFRVLCENDISRWADRFLAVLK